MIRVDTRGACVHATLDTPATNNALDDAMVQALHEALALAQSQPEVRAFVLRGANGHFSAGGDLSRFRELIASPAPADAPDPIARFNRRFGEFLERLADAEVATVAIVEGAAMGGGLGLVAACDMAIASDDARFATPEVTLGLPPAQIAPFVAARLGAAAASRLLLTGHRLDAAAALACGLVDEVCPREALDARELALLDGLRRAEPAALRATKAILRATRRESRGDVLDRAAMAFARAMRSGRASEGLAAFAQKQPAPWVPR